MGLTSASETKAEVLGSTHDRLNTGLGEPCRRYVARYMNTNHNQSTNKSEIRGIWLGADPSLTTHHRDDTRSSDTSDRLRTTSIDPLCRFRSRGERRKWRRRQIGTGVVTKLISD